MLIPVFQARDLCDCAGTSIRAGKTKRAFMIKALNVGAAQTFHVYTFAAGQGVRTTLTALP